jgi:hypothetical protein
LRLEHKDEMGTNSKTSKYLPSGQMPEVLQ